VRGSVGTELSSTVTFGVEDGKKIPIWDGDENQISHAEWESIVPTATSISNSAKESSNIVIYSSYIVIY